MAGVFTVVFLLVAALVVIGVRGYVRAGRRRWLRNPYLPVVLVAVVLSAYLAVKVAYEEIYPCYLVDEVYCDYDSTQYRNLFGWEF